MDSNIQIENNADRFYSNIHSFQPGVIEFYLWSSGRLNRSAVWFLYLGPGFLGFILMIAIAAIIDDFVIGSYILSLYTLFILWSGLMVMIKRWHDLNKSGWWVLINLIPILGQIWTGIALCLTEGDAGPNKYGDPLSLTYDSFLNADYKR